MLRRYAQVLGAVLVLVGLIGLFLGERLWLGVLNVDIAEDIVHLITGGLLLLVGFWSGGAQYARGVVVVLGALYLLVGALGFFVPNMFGLLPHGYSVWDNLLHLAIGILSLGVVFYSQRGTAAGWQGPGATQR